MPNYVKINNENFSELTYLAGQQVYSLDHGETNYENIYNRLNKAAANIFAHLGSSKTELDRKKIWIDQFHSTFTRGSHEIQGRAAIYDSTHLGLVAIEVENNSEIIEVVQEDGSTEPVTMNLHDLLVIPHAVTRRWPNLNGKFTLIAFEIVV